jgi:hypothetical protein
LPYGLREPDILVVHDPIVSQAVVRRGGDRTAEPPVPASAPRA